MHRRFFTETADDVTIVPSTVDVAKVSVVARVTTAAAITANVIEIVVRKRNRDDSPLVFNVPEVPNEVRGVFHQTTGHVNYTALIEFVKNISSTPGNDPLK